MKKTTATTPKQHDKKGKAMNKATGDGGKNKNIGGQSGSMAHGNGQSTGSKGTGKKL